MKKVLLVLVAIMGFAFAANAQNNLGVRFGGGQGYNAELSWQHGLGNNRLETDLGWAFYNQASSLSLACIYQIVLGISNHFAWYIGPGAYIGMSKVDGNSNFGLAVAGQVGIEYDFNIPLQLSLDIRPRFHVIPSTDFHWGDIALGVRYRF